VRVEPRGSAHAKRARTRLMLERAQRAQTALSAQTGDYIQGCTEDAPDLPGLDQAGSCADSNIPERPTRAIVAARRSTIDLSDARAIVNRETRRSTGVRNEPSCASFVAMTRHISPDRPQSARRVARPSSVTTRESAPPGLHSGEARQHADRNVEVFSNSGQIREERGWPMKSAHTVEHDVRAKKKREIV